MKNLIRILREGSALSPNRLRRPSSFVLLTLLALLYSPGAWAVDVTENTKWDFTDASIVWSYNGGIQSPTNKWTVLNGSSPWTNNNLTLYGGGSNNPQIKQGAGNGVWTQNNACDFSTKRDVFVFKVSGKGTVKVTAKSSASSTRTIDVYVGGTKHTSLTAPGSSSDPSEKSVYLSDISGSTEIMIGSNGNTWFSSIEWVPYVEKKEIIPTFSWKTEAASVTVDETLDLTSLINVSFSGADDVTASDYTVSYTYNVTGDAASNTSGNTLKGNKGGSVTVEVVEDTDVEITLTEAGRREYTLGTITNNLSTAKTVTVNKKHLTMTVNSRSPLWIGRTYNNNVSLAGAVGDYTASYTWASGNTSVAEVNTGGKVTTKARGTATITATLSSCDKYTADPVSYTLTVNDRPDITEANCDTYEDLKRTTWGAGTVVNTITMGGQMNEYAQMPLTITPKSDLGGKVITKVVVGWREDNFLKVPTSADDFNLTNCSVETFLRDNATSGCQETVFNVSSSASSSSPIVIDDIAGKDLQALYVKVYYSSFEAVTGITVTREDGKTGDAAHVLHNGRTYQFVANVEPTTATNKNVTWSVTGGKDILSINGNGLVTVNGTATLSSSDNAKIVATSNSDGTKVGEFSVTVENVKTETLTLSAKTNLVVGEKVEITASFSPSDVTNKSIHQNDWKVNGHAITSVANDDAVKITIEDGRYYAEALKAGEATVTATAYGSSSNAGATKTLNFSVTATAAVEDKECTFTTNKTTLTEVKSTVTVGEDSYSGVRTGFVSVESADGFVELSSDYIVDENYSSGNVMEAQSGNLKLRGNSSITSILNITGKNDAKIKSITLNYSSDKTTQKFVFKVGDETTDKGCTASPIVFEVNPAATQVSIIYNDAKYHAYITSIDVEYEVVKTVIDCSLVTPSATDISSNIVSIDRPIVVRYSSPIKAADETIMAKLKNNSNGYEIDEIPGVIADDNKTVTFDFRPRMADYNVFGMDHAASHTLTIPGGQVADYSTSSVLTDNVTFDITPEADITALTGSTTWTKDGTWGGNRTAGASGTKPTYDYTSSGSDHKLRIWANDTHKIVCSREQKFAETSGDGYGYYEFKVEGNGYVRVRAYANTGRTNRKVFIDAGAKKELNEGHGAEMMIPKDGLTYDLYYNYAGGATSIFIGGDKDTWINTIEWHPNETVTLATSVGLNQSSATLDVEETVELTATLSPTNATNYAGNSFVWYSANPAIATVSSDGVVTAVAPGVTQVYAASTLGALKASCLVTVKAAAADQPLALVLKEPLSYSDVPTDGRIVFEAGSNLTAVGTLKATIGDNEVDLSIEGLQLKFTPHTTLTANTTYTVNIPAGIVKNSDGMLNGEMNFTIHTQQSEPTAERKKRIFIYNVVQRSVEDLRVDLASKKLLANGTEGGNAYSNIDLEGDHWTVSDDGTCLRAAWCNQHKSLIHISPKNMGVEHPELVNIRKVEIAYNDVDFTGDAYVRFDPSTLNYSSENDITRVKVNTSEDEDKLLVWEADKRTNKTVDSKIDNLYIAFSNQNTGFDVTDGTSHSSPRHLDITQIKIVYELLDGYTDTDEGTATWNIQDGTWDEDKFFKRDTKTPSNNGPLWGKYSFGNNIELTFGSSDTDYYSFFENKSEVYNESTGKWNTTRDLTKSALVLRCEHNDPCIINIRNNKNKSNITAVELYCANKDEMNMFVYNDPRPNVDLAQVFFTGYRMEVENIGTYDERYPMTAIRKYVYRPGSRTNFICLGTDIEEHGFVYITKIVVKYDNGAEATYSLPTSSNIFSMSTSSKTVTISGSGDDGDLFLMKRMSTSNNYSVDVPLNVDGGKLTSRDGSVKLRPQKYYTVRCLDANRFVTQQLSFRTQAMTMPELKLGEEVNTEGSANKVITDKEGRVELTRKSGDVMYYTTDGSNPFVTSHRNSDGTWTYKYDEDRVTKVTETVEYITINKTTVIKAISIDEANGETSPLSKGYYLFAGSDITYADPDNALTDDYGILPGYQNMTNPNSDCPMQFGGYQYVDTDRLKSASKGLSAKQGLVDIFAYNKFLSGSNDAMTESAKYYARNAEGNPKGSKSHIEVPNLGVPGTHDLVYGEKTYNGWKGEFNHAYLNDMTTIHEKTFHLPAFGSHFIFEPKADGVVTVWVMQQGALGQSGDGGFNDKQLKLRPVYIYDEAGNTPKGTDGTPIKATTTAKLNGNWQTTSKTELIADKYSTADQANALKELLVAWVDVNTAKRDEEGNFVKRSGGTDETYDEANKDKYLYEYGERSYRPQGLICLYKNAATEVEDMNGVKYNYTDNITSKLCEVRTAYNDVITEGEDNGFMLISEGYVRYDIPVQAGKTYFIWGYHTKLGFCGYKFTKAADYDSKHVGTIELKDTEDNIDKINDLITKAKNGEKCDVKLTGRKFAKDKWSTLVLPFSVSFDQLKAVFGDEVQVVHFNKITTSRLKFLKHVHQMIVAGTPVFIKPSGEIPVKSDDDDDDDDEYINNPTFRNVTMEINEDKICPIDDGSYRCVAHFMPMTRPAGSFYLNSSTNIFHVTSAPYYSHPGFRIWLEPKTAEAREMLPLSFSISSFGDEDDDEETTGIVMVDNGSGIAGEYINGNVYNINGQVVRSNSQSLEGLPKGVYIINGVKHIVK